MIKLKTFNVNDETINDFINEVAVIANGITTHNDNITVVYRDSKYPEYDEEARLQSLHTRLAEEKATLDGLGIEMAYFELKEDDDNTENTRELLKNKELHTKNMIVVLENAIKDVQV